MMPAVAGTLLQPLWPPFSLAVFVLFFYRWLSPAILNRVKGWMSVPVLEKKHPTRDVYGAIRFTFTGVLQAIMFCILAYLYKPIAAFSFKEDFNALTLALSVVLGIAEMSVATLFGFSLMQVVRFWDSRMGNSPQPWAAVARGGWIQLYFKALQVLPTPLGALSVFLYITFEECVFRMLLIGSLETLGREVALVIATCLFIVYQQFHTPGWQTAMFPMAGAVVVGTVHGILYLVSPHIVPLAVAHFSFFMSSLWSVNRMDRNRIVWRVS